jgi:2-polyprenyl-3-methyl-5-hydroxy-6-metoxy-1,4-benzoquinol methylase/uncharacterized protein YbaR (Trm112 family)
MTSQLLNLLICPVCRSGDLRLVVFSGSDDEAYEGILQCLGCSAQYPIEAGVLELLPPALRYENDRRAFFDRWTTERRDRGLPEPPEMPTASAAAATHQASDQQKHFDWYADNETQSYGTYAETRFWSAIDEQVFAPWKSAVSRTAAERHCTVLDVGCAQGRSTFHLAGLGAHLVGFDVSKRCIRVARARSRESRCGDASFICADVASFPFKSSTFDYVLVYGVLHHVADPARTCVEIARVLKPGGTYLGSENNRTVFRPVFDLLQRLRPEWHELAGPEALISARTLRTWMDAAGLRLEARSHTFVPPHLVNLLPIRAGRQLLGTTDAVFGSLPYLRDNGGLVTFTANKSA